MTPDTPPPDSGDEWMDDATVRPPPMQTAVRLMVVGAVSSFLVPLIGLLSASSIKSNITAQLRQQHDLSQHNLDTVYQNVVVSTVAVAVLGAGMWLIMAWANGLGQRWARLTASMLGVVNIALFALSLTAGEITVLQLAAAGLSVFIAIAVLWLLWRPESTYFFDARSHRR